jgi:JmjC domain
MTPSCRDVDQACGRLTGVEVWPVLRQAIASRRRLFGELPATADGRELTSLEACEAMLFDQRVPVENVRLVRNGSLVPPLMYRTREGGKLQPDAVRRLCDRGVSIVLNHLEVWEPMIASAATTLGAALDARVVVNAYQTYGPEPAFRPHVDDHDVLAMQLCGAKRWTCFASPSPGEPAGRPVWTDVLSAGQFLYVPEGEQHAATPETTPSLHLAIGFRRFTRPKEQA